MWTKSHVTTFYYLVLRYNMQELVRTTGKLRKDNSLPILAGAFLVFVLIAIRLDVRRLLN